MRLGELVATSPFARHNVEEVPVLGLAVGGDAVALLLGEYLEGESGEQALDIGAGVMGDAGLAAPLVALAEELAGKAPTRPERPPDARPQFRKPLGRTERQREAGIDQIDRRPCRILEA